MSSFDAVAAEATRDPSLPLLTRTVHGRAWKSTAVDVRPVRLRHYALLAEAVAGKEPSEISGAQAVELSAMAEEMLRSALPPADREAFDTAPFTGTEIGALIADYTFAGSPEDALDCAYGLYLSDPTAWQPNTTPTN